MVPLDTHRPSKPAGSRTTLVGALFAVEAGILGAIVYFLGGTAVGASSLHPQAVEMGGDREVRALDAGATPRVIVRDPNSRVIINVARDGRVHVIDHTRLHGVFFGGATVAPLHVTAEGNSVLIERTAQTTHFAMFGESRERVEVQVPAAAAVDVQESSGTDVSGLQAGVKVRSQDGHIDVTETNGDIDVESDDGHIDLIRVRATHISAVTRDGHITAKDIAVAGSGATATLHTDSGHIRLSGSLDANGKYALVSADGGIDAALPASLGFNASTADGSIRFNGQRVGDADGGARYRSAGASSGSLELTTQSGRITINTSGVI